MLSNDVSGYDALCEAPHPSGKLCRWCRASRCSCTPSGLTPALGRDEERDAEVVVCTAVSHAETVNRAWHTLIQHRDASGLAWGTCRLCHSTLCKQLPVMRWWTIRRSDEVRVEFADGHQTVMPPSDLDERLTEEQFAGTDDSLSAALSATDAAYEAVA